MAPLTQLIIPDTGLQAPATAADLPLAAAGGPDGPAGLYLHVPFCLHKCHYCDFYSLVETGPDSRQPAFTDRLVEEIAAARPWLGRPLETIFAGGGTPTLLEPDLWRRLLAAIGSCLPVHADLEFTVEANPDALGAELLEVLVAGGVNRISMGAQSFDPRLLKTLERTHDPANVTRSVELARAAGITNLNIDLIFGIPGQDLEGWSRDLDAVLALAPEHVSCYGLTYEPNTPMTARLHAGAFRRVDEAVEAAMYELAIDRLAAAGFVHYEISNWSRPGRACRHNLLYWRNRSWWPLGPGAAGHVAGVRWKNAPRLGDYLRARGLPPIIDAERLDEDGRIGETLMLGLRLLEGVAIDTIDTPASGGRGAARRAAVERHEASGLLEIAGDRLRFTRRGLLLADTVLADLL